MDLRYVPPALERLWADEVLYLHSLWHQGSPSNPNPNLNLRPTHSAAFKKESKKKKKKKKKKTKKKPQPSDPPVSEIEWPIVATPHPNLEAIGWPDLIPNPSTAKPRTLLSAEQQAKAAAVRVQQNGLRASQDFFSKKDGSSSDDEDEDEDDEDELKAFNFFLGLFEKDGDLRGYYEKNSEKGEFCCLVCGGIGVKKGKRFRDCVGLVQHSNLISKTKRRGAHRAFGRAVCRVLGWDINRLPSIVLDLGEPLGQSLAKAANPEEDLQKEGGIEKNTEIPQQDGANGDSMDCIEAEEIVELPNKEGADDKKKEVLIEVDEHPGCSKKKQNDSKKKQQQSSGLSNSPVAEIEWPCKPTPDLKLDATGWADLIPMPAAAQPRLPPSAEEQAWAVAMRVQQNGLKECRDFFAKKDGSSSNEEEEDEMDEGESAAFKFFLGLFEKDRDLRNYYEKNCEKGEFCCLVCGGIGAKKWKRFRDCVGLVQHSNLISNTKRKGAHRALGRAVCRVLGWNINRTPSIVLDREGPLGQSLAKATNPEHDLQKDGAKGDLMDCIEAKELTELPNHDLQKGASDEKEELLEHVEAHKWKVLEYTVTREIIDLSNDDSSEYGNAD